MSRRRNRKRTLWLCPDFFHTGSARRGEDPTEAFKGPSLQSAIVRASKLSPTGSRKVCQTTTKKKVHLHFNTALNISAAGESGRRVKRPQSSRPPLCGDGVLEWIGKYFAHYTIAKTAGNVFITLRGFRNSLCTCIYNTQHLFPELKHRNNMSS